MSSSNRFFEGLFVGGIIGFLAGLLYAPKPGSQIRQQLAENSVSIAPPDITGSLSAVRAARAARERPQR